MSQKKNNTHTHVQRTTINEMQKTTKLETKCIYETWKTTPNKVLIITIIITTKKKNSQSQFV